MFGKKTETVRPNHLTDRESDAILDKIHRKRTATVCPDTATGYITPYTPPPTPQTPTQPSIPNVRIDKTLPRQPIHKMTSQEYIVDSDTTESDGDQLTLFDALNMLEPVEEARYPHSSTVSSSSKVSVSTKKSSKHSNGVIDYKPGLETMLQEITGQQSGLEVQLNDHLVKEGYAYGSYSDIKLTILEKQYNLHRIILARFPFFEKLLNTVTPRQFETVNVLVSDPLVTSESIDLVLRYVYSGKLDIGVGQLSLQNAISILSASLYFGVTSLVDQVVKLLVETVCAVQGPVGYPQAIIAVLNEQEEELFLQLIDFIDSDNHGEVVTGRLEEAVLRKLCLNGYSNMKNVFIKMPLSWFERVIEADSFWCPSEFERYLFARDVIHGRGKMVDSFRDIMQYSIIYAHMTEEQLNVVKQDAMVPYQVLKKYLPSSTGVDLDHSDDTASRTMPLRVGLTFKANFGQLNTQDRTYSAPFFCDGYWWQCFVQRFVMVGTQSNSPAVDKWGVFLRRAEYEVYSGASFREVVDPLSKTVVKPSKSYRMHGGEVVSAQFSLFNPLVKTYDSIFESKVNQYAESQSWGYRSASNVVPSTDGEISLRMSLVLQLI